MSTEPLVSVGDISKRLGVVRSWVDRCIDHRALPAHRIGTLWTFHLSEMDDWGRSGRAADADINERGRLARDMTASSTDIDLARLFKLRLIVARHGEMDVARWWNTNGILARRGSQVLKRGFPATLSFAQARIAFAVARSRCQELFNPPGCMTLWSLPADVEDQFEERWQDWLDEGDQWQPVFEKLSDTESGDLLRMLEAFGLTDGNHLEAVAKLRRSAEGRSVPLSGTYRPDNDVITLLAAGFARGEPGSPAIPYARLDD